MAKPDGPGQIKALPQKRQPQLHATGIPPWLKPNHLQQLPQATLAAADGREIPHRPELMLLQRLRHPEATLRRIGHRLAVVVGQQHLDVHGGGLSQPPL